MLAEVNTSVAADGFSIVSDVVDLQRINDLLEGLADCSGKDSSRKRRGAVYAIRNLLATPVVREIASSDAMCELVGTVLGGSVRVIRGTLFDKTVDANWKVPWHQDLSIAVKERIEVEGFGPWSVKEGVVHVQPPRAVLEAMLTVRLHLDDCGADNAPLRVVSGSHSHGVLRPDQVARFAALGPVTTCEVSRGGAVLMRPLILHASSPAVLPAHRRVLHLEFTNAGLPGGLDWHWS